MYFRNHSPILIITLISLLLFIGCGYHFRADGNPVGLEIKGLAIPLMSSTSSDKGFEADFTRIIREEFISHSRVPIVDTETADAVLVGRIHEITTRPLTYDTLQQAVGGQTITYETTSSRRLIIRLDISLKERKTGKEIWSDNSMEEDARFEVGGDPLANRYNQQQALMKIARLFAKRIYLKTMERF